METTKVNNLSFKGLGARPLRALVAREPFNYKNTVFGIYPNIIERMSTIGKKEGFDVFTQTQSEIINSILTEKTYKNFDTNLIRTAIWTQDELVYSPNKKFFSAMQRGFSKLNESIQKYFKIPVFESENLIPGGNMFFIKEGSENSLIIGWNNYRKTSTKALQQTFGVDNVYPITQPDFHIDLGIRPLRGNTILVEDSKMTLRLIEEGFQKADDYLKINPYEGDVAYVSYALKNTYMKAHQCSFEFTDNDKIVQAELKEYGFNVVKVPGALRTWHRYGREEVLERDFNLLNAIVHERPDGSLVYITNSADESQFGLTPNVIKKLGFSIEERFKESIKDYVAPEDVHFIDIGNILREKKGGIHCLFAEIPLD